MAAADSGAAVDCYGPVEQRQLLWDLGIDARCQARRGVHQCSKKCHFLQRLRAPPRAKALLDATKTDEQAEAIIRGYARLTGDDAAPAPQADSAEGAATKVEVPGMGVRYKAMAMVQSGLHVPVGFAAASVMRGGRARAAAAPSQHDESPAAAAGDNNNDLRERRTKTTERPQQRRQ